MLVDVNFSELGLVLLGCVSLGKSQQFLDELEPYKERKKGLFLVEKQKVYAYNKGAEVLLYDLGVEISDTIEVLNWLYQITFIQLGIGLSMVVIV